MVDIDYIDIKIYVFRLRVTTRKSTTFLVASAAMLSPLSLNILHISFFYLLGISRSLFRYGESVISIETYIDVEVLEVRKEEYSS